MPNPHRRNKVLAPLSERTLAWIKQRSLRTCPDCGGTVPDSLIRCTAWCPACRQPWKMTRFAPGEKGAVQHWVWWRVAHGE